MTEKMYKVLNDQKYTGKHRVYCGKGSMGRTNGDVFPESELFGNESNIKMALEGQKDVIRRFASTKDATGKLIQGAEYVAIKGKSAKIELIVNKKSGKK